MADSASISKAGTGRTYEFVLGDELRGERATMGKSLLDVQRDLRIRAEYVAAIEDARPEVFPNPGFVPGYVRSYARYLGLDTDEIYARFCQESGFVAANAAAAPAGARRPQAAVPARGAGGFRPDFPMAELRGGSLPRIPVSALGSLLVLVALIGGLGYGGWTVLQNIQRVRFAPVEAMPLAVVDVDPLVPPTAASLDEPGLRDLAKPVSATALAELYRQQELEVPILVPRDGPIAGLDPDRIGLLAGYGAPQEAKLVAASGPLQPVILAAVQTPAPVPDPQVTATATRPQIILLAERAAWVRVYLGNGTVIFERILENGETYSPPDDVEAPLVWAGNSGSVYVRVGDTLRGPLGPGTKAVRDVVLEPQALTERFPAVSDVPEVISRTLGAMTQRADAGLATQ